MGETYEGLYVMPEGNVDIFMESDFIDRTVKDLITGETLYTIKKDSETTYLQIEGPKGSF